MNPFQFYKLLSTYGAHKSLCEREIARCRSGNARRGRLTPDEAVACTCGLDDVKKQLEKAVKDWDKNR